MLECASEARERRPLVDRDLVLAYSYLRSRYWQDPYAYKSLLDGHDPPLGCGPRAVPRERRLSDDDRGQD
jgi:hypothetical protein